MRTGATGRLFDVWGRDPLKVARDNKLLDVFFEEQARSGIVTLELESCRKCRDDIRRAVVRLATAVQAAGIDWAVFKTMRPFPFTPSDVDVVVFTDGGAGALASYLCRNGYQLAGGAPHTITVSDTETDVGIDLYQDIAASRFVYLDRVTFRPYRTWHVLDGVDVPVLHPVAELISILAHAVYKEQMFTLADYLTLRHHAEAFEQSEWTEFLRLADANGIRHGVLWCMRVVKGVAQMVDDGAPWPESIDWAVGPPLIPRTVPYRLLNPWMLSRAVAERSITSRIARRTLAQVVAQVLNPLSPHTRSFYRQLWKRAKGETY